MKIIGKIIGGFTILSFMLIIYATYIERTLLTVKKEDIVLNDNWKTELKVVQFTDTQLGEFYDLDELGRAVEKINGENPDIVVFTGDLIDNASQYDSLDKISTVLSNIEANYGKYAVYGNHDYGGGAVNYYEDIMNEAGFKILKNENDRIEFDNFNLNILGADDALIGNYSPEDTVMNINSKDVNILLLHEPDLIKDFLDYPIDLTLSGHSHGGQVYIPFYGPLKKTYLAETYTKGIYKFDNEKNTKLYVNSGLGNTKFPFRFFNVPQITVFNLKI